MVTLRAGWRGRNEDGNNKRRVWREQGGQQGTGRKRIPLVVDASAYWAAYKGDGDD